MDILFASNNPGKVAEVQQALSTTQFRIIPQSEFALSEWQETGLTFIENAIAKARHLSQFTNKPALADDSGLAVAALNGAPGIYSARYAHKDASSAENITKLLADLKGVPLAKRQATFHCVMAFLLHAQDPTPIICHGSWRGLILETPSGEKGFGYDPIFFIEAENCSAAQLSMMRKNQISHRAQALSKLLAALTES